ncbi:hypothetical protein C8R46DRAFT_472814 [Mycena filopes]|nr:hypothetical protein C8R46DRAFT_472814 [Mycena filopes]
MPSLLDLPTELLVEITKHYPPLFVSEVEALLHEVRVRQFVGIWVLSALSRTCRALRNIFLPAVWARVHGGPCWPARPSHPRDRPPPTGTQLTDRMKTIQKNPHIRPYIQSLSIDLREATMQNCQPIIQFIRTLRALPTLRALTILAVPIRDIFIASFEDFSFPSVVTLTLPDDLASILHCFPNIQVLNTADEWHCNRLIKAAGVHCKQLNVLNNISLHSDTNIQTYAPNVHTISIRKWLHRSSHYKVSPNEAFRSLEGMCNLSRLLVRWSLAETRSPKWDVNSQVNEIVALAKQVLQTSKASGSKELRIQHLRQLPIYSPDRFEMLLAVETLMTLDRGEWTTVIHHFPLQLSDYDLGRLSD